jgi:hypothetical protein
MTTMTISIPDGDSAILQVLKGLSKMGAIIIERKAAAGKSLYDERMVEKIRRGDRDLREGKGIKVDPDNLWK